MLCDGSAYIGKSKLAVLLGSDIFSTITGKVVIDFGCGDGEHTVEMAQKGAKRVIGLDIRESVLTVARQKAAQTGVTDNCVFATSTTGLADYVVSLDAFEHFSEPGEILNIINSLLKPQGEVLASFGPTWYHPLGGHSYSVFPWSHLLFTEKAFMRWRATYSSDAVSYTHLTLPTIYSV